MSDPLKQKGQDFLPSKILSHGTEVILGDGHMKGAPKPPDTYQDFRNQFPQLGAAWDALGEAGRRGPLDDRTIRLVKLALAIGALREGAVHANVRKALADGVDRGEIEQVVALAAGTIGLPATVAVYSWVRDGLGPAPKRSSGKGR